MNRCVLLASHRLVRLSVGLLVICLWSFAGPAQAQPSPDHRVFPANALRGELTITSATEIQLNGQAGRLAPGARIRGADNQLQLSAALVGQRMTVHYTHEKSSGLLMDIWLLRPVERNNRPWPASEAEARSWSFDPAAQTWKKP